jgi:O-acetyl-ADP-ribose deacetylase (regulator of RNase III)
MPLLTVKGNLLDSDCQVMMHQCNCFSTMGAGIAKQFAQKWPEVSQADKAFMPYNPTGKLGQVSRALVAHSSVFVYNLYGQYNYGTGKQQTNYEALNSAIRKMLEELKQLPMFTDLKMGLPYGMGCGLAGGDWKIVSAMLEKISAEYGVDFYAYQL